MTIDDSELQAVGWMWPAYISNGAVEDLIDELKRAPASDRPEILATHLARFYSAAGLAPMVVHRYRRVPVVRDHASLIEQAVEAAQLGLFAPAVATLLGVVEGLLRDVAGQTTTPPGHGRAELSDAIQHLIDEAAHGHGVVDEIQQMLRGFKAFFDSRLYTHTKDFDGSWSLNRHGIAHGLFKDYGQRASFGILMSIVDQLTFIMTLRTSGVSALAPDPSAESNLLFGYYRMLHLLSLIRPRAEDVKAP